MWRAIWWLSAALVAIASVLVGLSALGERLAKRVIPMAGAVAALGWRIMRQFHGKVAAVEVSEEEVRETFSTYYPDVKAALKHMWKGGECMTCGHTYYIERKQPDGSWGRNNAV